MFLNNNLEDLIQTPGLVFRVHYRHNQSGKERQLSELENIGRMMDTKKLLYNKRSAVIS